MEYLKRMSIKKAYFCLTIFFLLFALFSSILFIWGTGRILNQGEPILKIKMEDYSAATSFMQISENDLPFWYNVLRFIQLILPLFFIMTSLLLSDLVLYQVKLKIPLAQLQEGAEYIMQNRLDFSISYDSKDELGKLCCVFEEMRKELLKNNQEIWRQMEERKRLNAAFSHDLRNPITVLKGSAKLLKKELVGSSFLNQNMEDSLLLTEEYIERIEGYIETMSSVQRLEQLQCSFQFISFETLLKELSNSIRLIALDSGIQIREKFEKKYINIGIDKAILFNVVENLVINAVRYAKVKIEFTILLENNMFIISIQDDGPGFPQLILQKGAKPFLRGDTAKDCKLHFGIGLYVCRLLCEKHKGELFLENNSEGALVTAKFKILLNLRDS